MIEELKTIGNIDIEDKLNIVYGKITDISNEYFRSVFYHFEKNLKKGNLEGIVRSVSSFIPAGFLSMPFFSTLKHMNNGKQMLDDLKKDYFSRNSFREKTILWFTDTMLDMNGVAETIREIAWLAYRRKRNIFIVTSMPADALKDLPPNVINISQIYEFELPYYENIILKVPSMLEAIKVLHAYEPDEVYISSPGPMGLLGLLMSYLLNIKSVNVYHTDFSSQVREIVGNEDESIPQLVEGYMKWFYSVSDEIRVPTYEYMTMLEQWGFPFEKMKIFRRAIDGSRFIPVRTAKNVFNKKFGVKKGINLLYAGRMSKDKNLDFLVSVFEKVKKRNDDLNLIIAGDGPYMPEFKEKVNGLKNLYLLGRVPRGELPEIYSCADLFLFPSTTDTFGMVVLEAQACGLPALVSDIGGPKEIGLHGKTGRIIEANDFNKWSDSLALFVDIIRNTPNEFNKMRDLSQKNSRNYNWDVVLSDILGEEGSSIQVEIYETAEKTAAPLAV